MDDVTTHCVFRQRMSKEKATCSDAQPGSARTRAVEVDLVNARLVDDDVAHWATVG